MSSEVMWEMFDALYKTVHRQGQHVEALEVRVEALERRLPEDVSLARPLLSVDSARRCEQVGRTLNEKDEPDFDSPDGNVEWEGLK